MKGKVSKYQLIKELNITAKIKIVNIRNNLLFKDLNKMKKVNAVLCNHHKFHFNKFFHPKV